MRHKGQEMRRVNFGYCFNTRAIASVKLTRATRGRSDVQASGCVVGVEGGGGSEEKAEVSAERKKQGRRSRNCTYVAGIAHQQKGGNTTH